MKVSKLAKGVFGAVVCSILMFAAQAHADTVTTLGPYDVSICCGDFSTHTPGSMALTEGEIVTGFNSQTYAQDQGFGGEVPSWVHMFVELTDNGTDLWGTDLADVGRPYQWYYYTGSADDLTALNAALSGIDWSSNPDIELNLDFNIQAYPEWAGYFDDSTLTVDTSTSEVPEPGSLMLLGMGLAGFAVIRRKVS